MSVSFVTQACELPRYQLPPFRVRGLRHSCSVDWHFAALTRGGFEQSLATVAPSLPKAPGPIAPLAIGSPGRYGSTIFGCEDRRHEDQ